ncbi:hypothetical protein C8R46DRAFT_1301771, partial [Mycena filopes]
ALNTRSADKRAPVCPLDGLVVDGTLVQGHEHVRVGVLSHVSLPDGAQLVVPLCRCLGKLLAVQLKHHEGTADRGEGDVNTANIYELGLDFVEVQGRIGVKDRGEVLDIIGCQGPGAASAVAQRIGDLTRLPIESYRLGDETNRDAGEVPNRLHRQSILKVPFDDVVLQVDRDFRG